MNSPLDILPSNVRMTHSQPIDDIPDLTQLFLRGHGLMSTVATGGVKALAG